MKTQLILRPTEELKRWLEQQAKAQGLSVNAVAVRILWDKMDGEKAVQQQ